MNPEQMNKGTIFIIPSWYKTKKNPNSGCFFREQAISLHRLGWNTVVLVAGFLGKNDIFDRSSLRINKYEDNGIHVYEYRIPSFFLGRIECFKWLGWKFSLTLLFLLSIRDFGRPCLIHAHGASDAGYHSLFWRKIFAVPLIVTEHSSNSPNSRLLHAENVKLKKVYNEAFVMVAVSNGLAEKMGGILGATNKIRVVPNMVDISKFFPTYQATTDSRFTYLACGNLIPRKGFDILIKAYSNVHSRPKKSRLIIIGDGPEKSNLEMLIKTFGLENNVHLIGQISRDLIPRYMRECDCFCSTSRNEPFGVVVIEAMACGKPIIATMTDGSNDIVGDNIGYRVPIDDVDAYADAMIRLSANSDRFSPLVIRETAEKKYGSDAVAQQINGLYNFCLGIKLSDNID